MARLPSPLRPPSRAIAAGDPFSELHREMNRLFDDFLGGGALLAPASLASVPKLDVRDGPQEIRVCAELPGVRPDAVEVRVEGNTLTLRGEKANEAEQKQEEYYLMERSFGHFQRSLQLPFAPDPQQVRAEFEHGVLTIHVPKQPEQERSHRIEIHSSGAHEPLAAPARGAGSSPAIAGGGSAGPSH